MKNNAKKLAVYLALTGVSISAAQAQVMAQDPLFARTSAVEPNIVFMLDDSGSMLSRHLFQFGGGTGGYGRGGPDNLNQGNGGPWVAPPSTVAGQSPDVNRLYYDPRTLYPRRVTLDASGNPTPMAAGPIGSVTSFPVYFYQPPGTTLYSVSGVSVSNGGTGYPASGVTAKFNAAPKGGVTALATVTTSPSTIVSGVTVVNRGSNYPNTGVTATFSDPPSGGITAQATVTTAATNRLSGVTVTRQGRDYPSTGVLATFSLPQLPGGTTATGTVNIATTNKVGSVSITTPGTGYPASGVTVSFGAAPANGTAAQGTVTTAPFYRVASLSLGAGGSGYTSAPTVAFSGTLATGGTAATGTATLASRYQASTATITPSAAGSGYTSAPTMTFAAPPVGGTAATGTATLNNWTRLTSATRVTGGAGCTNGLSRTITFNTPAGGTAAAGTVTVIGGAATSNVTITSGGTRYTANPTSFTLAGCTTQPTFTYVRSVFAGVASVSVDTAGSGYASAAAIPISFSGGGGGTGATASAAAVLYDRYVSAVTLGSSGSYYTAAPTVSLTGGGGSGAAVSLTTTSSLGISAINITEPGTGYGGAPTATLANVGGGNGYNRTVNLTATNSIGSITITEGGSGYTAAPTVTLTNTASGALAVLTPAVANTGRWVSSINMTNFGAGYASAPTLTLGNSGTGSGATFNVDTGTTNVVSAINVTRAGSGYFTNPVLTLTPSSGGGAAFAVGVTGTPGPGTNRVWDGNPVNPNPNTAAQYFTPGYLPDGGSPLAPGADATRTYPNLASVATSFYPKFLNRVDCTTIAVACTWAEEQQNYANWLLYHSTRAELAKTGIGLAFQPLNPTFRLGWGTINDMNSNSRLIAGVQLFNTTTKAAFLNWLYGAGISGGTPNRRAIDRVGQYYQRNDDDGPWATSPPLGAKGITATGADVTTHASCRRAYSLLMTDGYYNENFALNDVDTTIGTAITSPSPYQYTPIGPYSDKADGTAWNNTFADVAMKYWGTDLRPTLPNKIKPNSNDPAYWQHMNFYAIGLGVEGNMDATSASLLQDLSGNATSVPPRVLDWPQPAGNGPGAIDDMWHATINGRGKIFNAKTTTELTGAIGQMLSDVAGAEGSQAGVAVSTASLNSDTKKYTPRYTPITWTGNLTAYNLDATTAAQSTVAWEVETLVSTDPITGVRTYASTMPSAANRKIFVGNGSSTGARAVPFTLPGMGSLASQMTGTVTSDLIDYLRGDNTNEDTATTTTGLYRFRQTRLGDIVNSTPVFIKNTLDLKYDTLPLSTLGQSSYRAYVDGSGATPSGGKKQRAEGILAVGANDGMLHFFRDGTRDSAGTVVNAGGVETFAYVPNAILPTIRKLADKAYAHQYYVDGPLIETDGFLTSAGRWGNLILGSTGGGAGSPGANGVSPRTGVFAIDVTSLNSGPTTFNAASVLWEVGSSMADFEELGYVLTEIEAGTTIDGQWVAIFGNGYESKSCRAQLFVVNLETGALIKRIDTGVGSGNCADKNNSNRNGLGGVRVVRNSSQQIIGVYAGDQLGNLWKFNLNNVSPTGWNVDLANTPLFTAGSGKPITAAPSVIPLTLSSKPAGGYMVIAGTGKFFEVDDIVSTNQQSLYGIWDPVSFGTAVATTALSDTSRLVEQTIGSAQSGVDGNTYFSISANLVDYEKAIPDRGWFINMPNSGQRLIYPFELLKGQFILADTISPANVSLDVCTQNTAGTGYLYLLDGLTGAGPTIQVFDTNGDGSVDSNDLVVSGIQGSADGKNKTIAGDQSTTESKFFNCSADSPTCRRVTLNCSLKPDECPKPNPGAATIDSRMWQQLFMR